MKTSITTTGLKPALIAALAILMLAVFAQPASAAINDIQHVHATKTHTGQLDTSDRRDGYWFFISGTMSSLSIKAESTNGADIGSMDVYSHRDRKWLTPAMAPSTSQSYSGNVRSGWHYVQVRNLDNSTTTYRITISTQDSWPNWDAGNTFTNATQLTHHSGNLSYRDDRVGLGDSTDIFEVTLPAGINTFTVWAYETWSGGATVQLLNENRTVLQTASVNGTTDQLIQRNLPGGTYFVRVTEAGSGMHKGTGYRLYVRHETQPDTAGNYSSPRYLGQASQGFRGTLRVNEFVSANADPIDVFSFDVPANGGSTAAQSINIHVQTTTNPVYLYLTDANGRFVANASGNGLDQRIGQNLRPGRYYLSVNLLTIPNETSYWLSIYNLGNASTSGSTGTSNPQPAATDRGSNYRHTATLFGMVNAQGLTISDGIGGTDVADWWRVNIPYPNVSTQNPIVGFVMRVTGLPSGAVVQMYTPTSSTPDVSVPAVNGVVQFTVSLSPGPWDVSITVPSGSATTTYTLSTCSFSTYLGCTLP